MVTYAVFLNGPVTFSSRLRCQIDGARVIAADAGIAHAASLDVPVELWVGDFDSSCKRLADAHVDVARRVHHVDKDETDGEIALREAVERGARHIVMVGGLGGASDHALAHLPQMLALAMKGMDIHVSSGHEEAWPLVPGRMRLDAPVGSRLSIIGFSDLCTLSLSNVRWPLIRRDVPFGSTLTMSNEVMGAVEIVLERGYAVIMVTLVRE